VRQAVTWGTLSKKVKKVGSHPGRCLGSPFLTLGAEGTTVHTRPILISSLTASPGADPTDRRSQAPRTPHVVNLAGRRAAEQHRDLSDGPTEHIAQQQPTKAGDDSRYKVCLGGDAPGCVHSNADEGRGAPRRETLAAPPSLPADLTRLRRFTQEQFPPVAAVDLPTWDANLCAMAVLLHQPPIGIHRFIAHLDTAQRADIDTLGGGAGDASQCAGPLAANSHRLQ